MPVEDYLRLQARFQHLFAGPGRPDGVAALQAQTDCMPASGFLSCGTCFSFDNC